ncbi:SRPBCC family protein [Actibacterium sp. XHP0104]|uniref:SRPBCC family protein n=1 Tax=Actibacterium sp. XHP0104 TaxID=2984335 RepID=UPI0021E7A72C|nr:SRPBCC domain-containing protein [Actibacterium sp. XHP0104]MCV2881738.1 SRPBCC domain-containing protein [Actibacterium sp. XHP0104]
MTDVRLERYFPISADALFEWVTRPDRLGQWFGTEWVDMVEHDINFTRKGPWRAVMIARDGGQRFKVTGHVTHLRPPHSVGFTWAWHDDTDTRGPESHVTFTVQAQEEGAVLIIDHRDLPGDEAAKQHEQGWTSTLRRLEQALQAFLTKGD